MRQLVQGPNIWTLGGRVPIFEDFLRSPPGEHTQHLHCFHPTVGLCNGELVTGVMGVCLVAVLQAASFVACAHVLVYEYVPK